MVRSTSAKVLLTVVALTGVVLISTRSPSTAQRLGAGHFATAAGVAHQAVGWETTIRELSVGP